MSRVDAERHVARIPSSARGCPVRWAQVQDWSQPRQSRRGRACGLLLRHPHKTMAHENLRRMGRTPECWPAPGLAFATPLHLAHRHIAPPTTLPDAKFAVMQETTDHDPAP